MSSTFEVRWHEDALDDLRRLDRSVARRIVNRVESKLSMDPRGLGRALKGPLRGLYRFRVGDYRVVYLLEEGRLLILVVRVRHRKSVYR